MKLVYICSPYRATDAETLQRNIEYAKTLTRAALLRGECPVATPVSYTHLVSVRREVFVIIGQRQPYVTVAEILID